VFDEGYVGTKLKSVKIFEGVLLPGDTIYIPPCAAHGALNLETPTIGISSNFMDSAHSKWFFKNYCVPFGAEMITHPYCLISSGHFLDFKMPGFPQKSSMPWLKHFMSETLCRGLSNSRRKKQCHGLTEECRANEMGVKKVRSRPDRFVDVDQDEDDYLSHDEMVFFLARALGPSLSSSISSLSPKKAIAELRSRLDPAMEQIFFRLDINKDGRINFKEWAAMEYDRNADL
jgi:hypothetical protein